MFRKRRKKKDGFEKDKKLIEDVITGKYGNGIDRKINLSRAGYDYDTVQREVNDYIIAHTHKSIFRRVKEWWFRNVR